MREGASEQKHEKKRVDSTVKEDRFSGRPREGMQGELS